MIGAAVMRPRSFLGAWAARRLWPWKILAFRVYAQVGFAYNRAPRSGTHMGLRARTAPRGAFKSALERPPMGSFSFCLFVLEEGGADGPLFCFRPPKVYENA